MYTRNFHTGLGLGLFDLSKICAEPITGDHREMHAGRRLCLDRAVTRSCSSPTALTKSMMGNDWLTEWHSCMLFGGWVNTAKSNNVIWTAFFNVIFAVMLPLFILISMVFEGKQPMGIKLPEVKEMTLLWKLILMLFICIRTLIDFNYHHCY